MDDQRNEEELLERLQYLKAKREREEIEIARLTELHGSREAAIEVFFRDRRSKS
jgi:hypothetical protein